MTPGEAVALVRSLSYKPGSHLHAELCTDPWGVRVILHAPVRNVNNTAETLELFTQAHLPMAILERYETAHQFTDFIWQEVIRPHELHEAMEWFRLDDCPVLDPHPAS